MRARIIEKTRDIRKRQPKVGTRKLQRMLRQEGIKTGRDKLFEVLRENGLLIRRRRRYVHTTQSKHRLRTYKNLIKDITVVRPREVLVADITYIDTREGYKYLSLLTDKGSRKIVGYCLSHSLSIEGSKKALGMALKEIKGTGRVIHHSDRGIQYCSHEYTGILKEHNIEISMTEQDHVYENALAERVNGILKNELMLGEKIASYEVAKKMVREAVGIYNEERLHLSLGYMTPAQVFAA